MSEAEQAPNRRLTRVRLEYDDGTAHELTGEDAEAWLKDVNGAVFNAKVHGLSLQEHPWTQVVTDGRLDLPNTMTAARPRSTAAGAPTFREEQT